MRTVRIAVVVAAAFCGPAHVCSGQDSRPAREPGVLVRLYDIGQPMQQLPELAPGQLPNVAKIVSEISLGANDFEPLTDYFLTEVTGWITAETPGEYTFQLTSDDGSRLWIDDELVIDHDGLHGAEPKEGRIRLTEGEHRLHIRHFESTGDESLELQWTLPGGMGLGRSVTFSEVVSGSLLTHDTRTPWQTSPGKKRIIPPLRRGRPGDGAPLGWPHPSFPKLPALSHAGGRPATQRIADGWLPSAEITSDVPSPLVSFPAVWLGCGDAATADDALARVSFLGRSPYDAHLVLTGRTWPDARRVVFEDIGGCVLRFGRYDAGVRIRAADDDVAPQSVFEMLAVHALSNGLSIDFTQPLDSRCGWEADSYYVEQWPFSAKRPERRGTTAVDLTRPVRDGTTTPVKSASVSDDGRRVFLEIDGLEPSRVVYLRLLPPCLSEDGELPWSTEAWYTLNAIPKDGKGEVRTPPSQPPQNVLTDEERAAGWRLLFDGKTTKGWRGFRKDSMPDGWKAIDGCLVRVGPGGDVVTDDEFGDFELSLEWRISAGGNSGVFFHVSEDEDAVWRTGPEMQVLDNAEHADGRNPLTSTGSDYALHAPPCDVTEPVGLFNKARILVRGPHVEHWLNGVKVVEYELGSEDWQRRVAASKFASMPKYGRTKTGHIALQDHGDKVWFRNIKVRPLAADPK